MTIEKLKELLKEFQPDYKPAFDRWEKALLAISTEEQAASEEQQFVFGVPNTPNQETKEKAQRSLENIFLILASFGARETLRLYNIVRIALNERVARAESDIMQHQRFGRDSRVRQVSEYLSYYNTCLSLMSSLQWLNSNGWLGTRKNFDDLLSISGKALDAVCPMKVLADGYITLSIDPIGDIPPAPPAQSAVEKSHSCYRCGHFLYLYHSNGTDKQQEICEGCGAVNFSPAYIDPLTDPPGGYEKESLCSLANFVRMSRAIPIMPQTAKATDYTMDATTDVDSEGVPNWSAPISAPPEAPRGMLDGD